MTRFYKVFKTRVTLYSVFFGLFFFTACTNKRHNELLISKALNESIVASNNVLIQTNDNLFQSFYPKINIAVTHELALLWQSRAMIVKQLSDSLYNYLTTLENELSDKAGLKGNNDAVENLFITNKKGAELYKKEKEYRLAVLSVNEEISEQFKNKLPTIAQQFNWQENNSLDFVQSFFTNTSAINALAILHTFQNNILLTENKVVTYCYNMVGCLDCGGWYKTQVIIAQSSSIVEAGADIEITAGIGEFNDASAPIIAMNGKQIKLNDNGVAVYSVKAADKIGSHKVRVVIQYTTPNGTKQTAIQDVEYKVVSALKNESSTISD